MAKIVDTKNLSPEAKRALIDFPGSRQGTRRPLTLALDQETWRVLESHRLISPLGNLTRIGGIVRDRVLGEALDAL